MFVIFGVSEPVAIQLMLEHKNEKEEKKVCFSPNCELSHFYHWYRIALTAVCASRPMRTQPSQRHTHSIHTVHTPHTPHTPYTLHTSLCMPSTNSAHRSLFRRHRHWIFLVRKQRVMHSYIDQNHRFMSKSPKIAPNHGKF